MILKEFLGNGSRENGVGSMSIVRMVLEPGKLF
jgi:hypothetical protein